MYLRANSILVYDSATLGDKFMRYTFTFSKGREIKNEKTNELSKTIHHMHKTEYLHTRENDRQRVKQIFFSKNNNIQKYLYQCELRSYFKKVTV